MTYMNLPTKQPDVIDLTKLIRETHYQLQLDYQALMLKATSLQAENEDLKERLNKIAEKIQLGY